MKKQSKYYTQNDDGSLTINKLPLAFGVAGFIGGTCASRVVTSSLKNNLAPANAYQKVQVVIGCMVIGSIVSQYAGRYVEKELNLITEATREARAEQSDQN